VGGLRLGRYPFAAAVKHHMQKRYGILSERSYEEEERKLRMIAVVFEELKVEADRRDEDTKAKGEAVLPPFTTDPRRLDRREIQSFLGWMKKRGLDPTTQASYLKYLKNILRTYRNTVIEDLKLDGVRLPKPSRKAIRVIDYDDLDTIFRTLDKMGGWRGSVARGMISLYFATGVRPKEGRLVLLKDLDLKARRVLIRHPKGEGSWASAEEVDILRWDVAPFIERYLRERREWIKENGLEEAKVTELFPSIRFGKHHGLYSEQGFNSIKGKVEDLSGVDFRLKDFRSTLTTTVVRGDRSRLNAMSAQLRHDNIVTTQRFYEGIERGAAGRQLRDVYKERPIALDLNDPVIDKKFPPAGYG
jgi:integrase